MGRDGERGRGDGEGVGGEIWGGRKGDGGMMGSGPSLVFSLLYSLALNYAMKQEDKNRSNILFFQKK